jgi:hypothetical protein
MRLVWMLGLMATSLVIGWLLADRYLVRQPAPVPPPIPAPVVINYHTGPTIDQIRSLACLVTTRIDVADVQETRLSGRTGGVRAALLIKGDYLLGVDLSQAKFQSVDDAARTAVLLLPQPRVTSPRLDHERTKVFSLTQSGLWQVTPGGGQTSGQVIDRGYRDAQCFIAAACNDTGMIARSRQQAEQVLGVFFRAMDWKVTVRWVD